ncbi:hypothetical protein B0T24DRAFT_646905 [Lasiosphaeria ovina]|uniref:Uncharacterized protein n=1 Tax=Lasiosphaeria ovina TaxID=92902 RepID=A0AAE0KMN2_9PEZI|nr:hypothetical protein B0T24DRAFT_646905 [Lasiosphaeria ovina]
MTGPPQPTPPLSLPGEICIATEKTIVASVSAPSSAVTDEDVDILSITEIRKNTTSCTGSFVAEGGNRDHMLRGGHAARQLDSDDRSPSETDEREELDEVDDENYEQQDVNRYEQNGFLYDDYDTNSDWGEYGNVPVILGEYEEMVMRLEGSDDWNKEQRKIHELIYMRGLHPMIPSWWRMSFRMWGITQQHMDDVFTPKRSQKRVVIHAYGNELSAAKALESLFYLSQTVKDYEEIGYQDRIAPTVVKVIRNYYKWALKDASVGRRGIPPGLLVTAYPPDFTISSDIGEDTDGDDGGYVDEEGIGNGVEQDETGKGDGGYIDDDRDLDDLTDEQHQQRFTRAVSRDLEKKLMDMGQRWRRYLREDVRKDIPVDPPTLYAFAVVQHMVMLVSHDSNSSKNSVVVLEQVRLNDRGQWLWNALSIAIPINKTRDAIFKMRRAGCFSLSRDESDDPDI